jgi:hypothetical protein
MQKGLFVVHNCGKAVEVRKDADFGRKMFPVEQ